MMYDSYQVIGIAQVINKKGQEEHFTDEDEEVDTFYTCLKHEV